MRQGQPQNSATPGALVEAYEALLAQTDRMLEAARGAEWASLVDQEADYVLQVERVQRLDAEVALAPEARERKSALLERILENDLEIRRRLIERRDELGELIGTTRRQRNLRRAYGVKNGEGSAGGAHRDDTRTP